MNSSFGMVKMYIPLLQTVIIAITGWLFAFNVFANQAPQSFAQINYDNLNKRLNVTLVVESDDLARSLSYQSNRDINLTSDLNHLVDTEIVKYITQHFVVTGEDGSKLTFDWIGKAQDVAQTRLDFSVDIKNRQDIYLANRLLLDIERSYINHVTINTGNKHTILYDITSKPQLIFKNSL